MQMPQIRIQSQPALIGIRTNDAQLQIDSGPAKLSIQQPKADLQISTKQGRLTIDQKKALADVGIIPTRESVEKNATESLQKAMEGSKKRRHQGDMMMKIENGGNPIPKIAEQNGHRPMKTFNIGWIPSLDAVKFHYEPAEVHINAKANKPIIHSEQTRNQFHYQAGSVETYLRQQNELNIDFENLYFKGYQFEMKL